MSLLSSSPCKAPSPGFFNNNGDRPIKPFSAVSGKTPSSCRLPRCSWSSSPPAVKTGIGYKTAPFAAALAILLCSSPAQAGILSGFPGIESVPGPELPQIDFLNKFNEENQKKYAEADARFKESPLLKEFLEKSKLNKEKNKQAILDKYCLRGAEWGVGDCSAEGMSPEERDSFIAMLKKKTGAE